MSNYYNMLVEAFKDGRLYFGTDNEFDVLKIPNIYQNASKINYELKDVWPVFDASFYKGKLYLYFGVVPVILFYLPFNIITGLFLTDKLMVLLAVSGSFVLALLILKILTPRVAGRKEMPVSINLLSVILIGICGGQLFILLKSSTYEVSAMCMMFFLLFALWAFIKYVYDTDTVKNGRFLFLSGVSLALAVGSKPYCIIYVLLFFTAFIILEYLRKTSFKKIIGKSLHFLIPCFVIGIILAIYNYTRFDSIFEFGIKYQLNALNLYNYKASFKDLFIGLRHYTVIMPDLKEKFPLFVMVKSFGHSLGNEEAVGMIYMFPLIVFALILLPKTLKSLKTSKETILIIMMILCIFIGNLAMVSLFGGITRRYIFEFIFFGIILSLLVFYNIYSGEQSKKFLHLFFLITFVFTVFINISLTFSYNFLHHDMQNKIKNFLR